ncbi:NADPH-dependent FMN reductase [Streptomyces cellulosae]|uniref:NADPH-dependent FMN reductase n=1 Tax=Streptomyces cellulosae TaxID=1968 RepID=UPI0004C9AEB2|nr:NAD(P)H-dependent oxidoreductase [Streptomyces cellulosae]
MSKIAIVTGSVRSGRHSLNVANWVKSVADERGDAEYEVVDIAEYGLPVWDEAMPPMLGRYDKQGTRDWAATIDRFDGFVFVVSEYNHSISGALKNALDHLFKEWNNKAAGFVSYGGAGGARAVEHLRGILSELQIAHVRHQVAMGLFTDFKGYTDFVPTEQSLQALGAMLDQLLPWTKAMELVRSGELAPAPASA